MKKTITYSPYNYDMLDNYSFSKITQGKYIFSVEQDKILIHSGVITTLSVKTERGLPRSLIIYFDSISAQLTSILLIRGNITAAIFNEFFDKTKSSNLFRAIITNETSPVWLESDKENLILLPKLLKRSTIVRKFYNENLNIKSFLYLDESTPRVIKDLHRFFILKIRNNSKEDLVDWVDEFNQGVLNKLKDLDEDLDDSDNILKFSQNFKPIKSEHLDPNIQKVNTKSLLSYIKLDRVWPLIKWDNISPLRKLDEVSSFIKDNNPLNYLKSLKISLLRSYNRRITIIKQNKLIAFIRGKSIWINREFFTRNIQVKRRLGYNYFTSKYLKVVKLWIGLSIFLSLIVWIPIENLPTIPIREMLTPTWIDVETSEDIIAKVDSVDDIIARPYVDRSIEKVVSDSTSLGGWVSVGLTFLVFTAVYFLIADPCGLEPIKNLIKYSTETIKNITYPLHEDAIAEAAQLQSERIEKLAEEAARLAKDRNDIIQSTTRRLSEASLDSKTAFKEHTDLIKSLRRELGQTIIERDKFSAEIDILKEHTKLINDSALMSNVSDKGVQVSNTLLSEVSDNLSAQLIQMGKLSDNNTGGIEIEKLSKLVAEKSNIISTQTLQIDELKEKVSGLNTNLKDAVDTGVKQILQLTNKLNDILVERDRLAYDGKNMSDSLKDALNTIDTINNYWGSIGHKMYDGCPTAEWVFNNIEILKQLNKEILDSGGSATQINLSLANDLSVSISNLLAILT